MLARIHQLENKQPQNYRPRCHEFAALADGTAPRLGRYDNIAFPAGQISSTATINRNDNDHDPRDRICGPTNVSQGAGKRS